MKEKSTTITFNSEDIHQLAIDLDNFWQDYDPYEHLNLIEYTEMNITENEICIAKGEAEEIQTALQEAVTTYEKMSVYADKLEKAKELLLRLNNAIEFVKSKKETAI